MQKTYSTQKETEKAFLIGVAFKKNPEIDSELTELARLAETAGLEVVGQDFQILREITPATLLGSGKVEELKQKIADCNATIVIVDYKLTSSQAKNLEEVFDAKVIDRMSLILDIFSMRATTVEGKLQVELAKLKYRPLSLRYEERDVGNFRNNIGEKKSELVKRQLKKQIQTITDELQEIKEQRNITRQKRITGNKKQVAIVGYTNAGKSTLLNLITKANIYADDKLFATLDTTSRNLFLTPECQIILTDTVGFISKLPHELVAAFSATLEEANMADLILHVVDVSNKDYLKQMETVNNTLEEIGAKDIPQIVVYNKIDNISSISNDNLKENEVFVSAQKNIGIDKLKELIIKKLTNA